MLITFFLFFLFLKKLYVQYATFIFNLILFYLLRIGIVNADLHLIT